MPDDDEDTLSIASELERLDRIKRNLQNKVYQAQQELKAVESGMEALRLAEGSTPPVATVAPKDDIAVARQKRAAAKPTERMAHNQNARAMQSAIVQLMQARRATVGDMSSALGMSGSHDNKNPAYKALENNLAQVRRTHNVWREKGERGWEYWIDRHNRVPPPDKDGRLGGRERVN